MAASHPAANSLDGESTICPFHFWLVDLSSAHVGLRLAGWLAGFKRASPLGLIAKFRRKRCHREPAGEKSKGSSFRM